MAISERAMKTLDSCVLNEMTQRLAREFDPEQIILFGSHAWGEPDDDSDVDLLVILSESGERAIARNQRAHRCLSDLPVPKDILVKTRAEVDRFCGVHASLECQILEQGVVLYDRRHAGISPVLA